MVKHVRKSMYVVLRKVIPETQLQKAITAYSVKALKV